ncbi:probable RNA-dependent RNA polymerase 5 isoform X2 [Malania oleifera]|uniref:probable RNA-dependent RNA polymerase 5 isoform X2 n=1 Tax=Malania oleifera TaxID=397392 RepID=UPI0025AEA872|nr:probable RNA-dependent RNA polymerase 5 isoform X2 [Malania oleifera]
MADSSSQVVLLPDSVEQLLKQICAEKSQCPPSAAARSHLASLDEQASLEILREIRAVREIRTLSGFIIYMVKRSHASPGPSSAPVSPQESVCSSPWPQISASTSSCALSSQSTDDDAIRSPVPEHVIWSSSLSLETENGQMFSPQLVALGELEFRKAFLILNYVGWKKLEDVISANKIRELKHLPMRIFEFEIWNALGKNCINELDRQRGPYLNKQRTHLQRVLGDDNVLIVKFANREIDLSTSATCSGNHYTAYSSIAKEGILVGLRRYRFFVFKDGGKEEKKKNPTSSPVKCFFVRMESNAAFDWNDSYILSKKTVHEARCLFMHVHMVSSLEKYMARFSLILSKTYKLDVDLMNVKVETIDDLHCQDDNGVNINNKDGEPLIHTDGTGFISKDLALKCPLNMYKGTCFNGNGKSFLNSSELEEKFPDLRVAESHKREPPLLIQFRMFYNGLAVKGTLLVNRKLQGGTIQVRPSMIKVEADAKLSHVKTENSLEIVGTSNQPKKHTYLSKYLIVLLSYGGVPKRYFLTILMNALEEAQSIYSSKHAALRVSLDYGEMDDFIVARMILSGIPLNEPFMQYRLSTFSNEDRKRLKEGRLPITDCFYLMGTVDPTGTLERDEVCIILDKGQISGKVLVFKNPGLHFGDIHVLNAKYVKDLEDVVENSKYAIFFPTKGPRSLADEMANSDFDGDLYWVSRNPQLLEYFKASKPWVPSDLYSRPKSSKRKPCEFSAEELEHELFQLFLTTRFEPSFEAGIAADSWLAFMDRFLTLEDDCVSEKETLKRNMLQLVDIYYCALDAPKSGLKITVPEKLKAKRFPHFMGNKRETYRSTSILGEIYNGVEYFQKNITATKDSDVWTLPCFGCEVPNIYLNLWKEHYDQYRCEMTDALKHDDEIKDVLADKVTQKYKQLLYGTADFEDSPKITEQIYEEALAIYQITYEHARRQGAVRYCGFAWKVAGSALCRLYIIKQGDRSLLCSPSVLREVFNCKNSLA